MWFSMSFPSSTAFVLYSWLYHSEGRSSKYRNRRRHFDTVLGLLTGSKILVALLREETTRHFDPVARRTETLDYMVACCSRISSSFQETVYQGGEEGHNQRTDVDFGADKLPSASTAGEIMLRQLKAVYVLVIYSLSSEYLLKSDCTRHCWGLIGSSSSKFA